jgi:hypothetical protein
VAEGVADVSIVSRILATVGRVLRAVGREVAETIRWGAPRAAIGRSLNQGENVANDPTSIGGAIAVGEGRRSGTEANEGATTDRQPD